MSGEQSFLQVCEYITPSIGSLLQKIPFEIQQSIQEIRLRIGRAVVLMNGKTTWFLRRDGMLSKTADSFNRIASADEVEESFKLVCEYSVHSYQEEIRHGFVTLRGGHRVGLCGTGVVENNQVMGMKEISSMNYRIARQITGAADELMRRLRWNPLPSVLIIGETGSGKTTLLRDLIRQLSDGKSGEYVKVAVIDERGEIGASWRGIPQNDIGLNSDLYHLYPKPVGMSMALRTLSPQVIACDEIGKEDDVDGILLSMNAGASILATAHGTSLQQVSRRKNIALLLQNQVFQWAVILHNGTKPCRIKEICQLTQGAEEYGMDQNIAGSFSGRNLQRGRIREKFGIVTAGTESKSLFVDD
jgi:stage III sporulation protein AA